MKLFFFLISLLMPIVAVAQTAQITGRVTDASQAILVGANVSLVNTETGVRRTVQTNADGYFTVPLLSRGTYRIEVQQTGFKNAIRPDVPLDEGQILRADFVLELGQVTESVEVSGTTPLLETERNTISTVIPNQKVLDLPTVGRNPLQFALLAPGVRGLGLFANLPVSAFDGSRISIGGGNPSGNNMMVDGIAAENFTSGGMQTSLSVDAVEEFRLIVRNPSAEYGRTGGGVINVISKAGTNEYHGSGYWFHRNENINANDFFRNRSGLERAPLTFNQYGATVGGPVKKDRTFFFFNWERFHERAVATNFRTVPTALQRAGNYSQTFDNQGRNIIVYDPLTTIPNPANPAQRIRSAFPGNVLPANRLSPQGLAMVAYYPNPNNPGAAFTEANNFLGQGSAPQDKDIYGIRMDHYFTPARRLAGRYTYDNTFRGQANFYGNEAELANSPLPFRRDSAMLTFSDAIRPNLLLELRGGLNRYAANRVPRSLGFDLTKLELPARLNDQVQMRVFPTLRPADATGLGTGADDVLVQANYAWAYLGNVTWINGAHTIKMGSENRVYQLNNTQISGATPLQFDFTRGLTQGPNPNVAAANAGFGIASMLLGYATSGNLGRWATSTYTAKNYALFVQDDWKVTSKLTLNLGLRWEVETGITDRFDALTNFDTDVQSSVNGLQLRGGVAFPGVGGLSRGHRDFAYTDFQPRVGFAWQVIPKTVIRAGYGISFLPTTGGTVTYPRTGFAINTPMLAQFDFLPSETLANPFSSGIIEPSGSSQGPLTGLGLAVGGNIRNLKRGYSQQWNFNVQRELPWQWLIEVGYMGNRGVSLPANYSFDYLPNTARALGNQLQQQVPNPFQGIVTVGALSQPTVALGTLLDTYPQFLGASGLTSWADSNYHAGTLRAEKRFSQGFSATVAYTFSKLIDNNLGNGNNNFADSGANDVQNWEDLRSERAISTSNLPHRLAVSGTWALPIARNSTGFARQAFAGWQVNSIVTWQSGNTLSVVTPTPAFGGNRPNILGDPSVENPTVERWLNRDAFAVLQPFQFGNGPRNLPRTRSDSLFQWDFSVLKDFPIWERTRLQFRAEFFNFTNTPTFGNPGNNITAGNFGVINSLATGTAPRQIQLALKLYF
jgi:outer membrane receptor protein involved in Fe transport